MGEERSHIPLVYKELALITMTKYNSFWITIFRVYFAAVYYQQLADNFTRISYVSYTQLI